MPVNRDSVSPTSLFLNEFQLENMISGDNISLTFMCTVSPLLHQRRRVLVVEVVASGSSGMFSFKKYSISTFARKHYLSLWGTKFPKAVLPFILNVQILNHISLCKTERNKEEASRGHGGQGWPSVKCLVLAWWGQALWDQLLLQKTLSW